MTNNSENRNAYNELGRPLFGAGSIFEEIFNGPASSFFNPLAREDKQWKDEDGYHSEYIVAGFDKSEIDVRFNDKANTITIKAVKDEGEASRKFDAVLVVVEDVSKEDIKTSYKNGVLRFDITPPKNKDENSRIHKLEIE